MGEPLQHSDTSPAIGAEADRRRDRRARRTLIRQAFGARLLWTFGLLLALVTTIVWACAGVLIHDTARRHLEAGLARHLEDAAALAAADLADQAYRVRLAREGNPEARAALEARLVRHKARAGVSGLALFVLPEQGGTDLDVLAATRVDGAQGEARARQLADLRAQLLADTTAIERARAPDGRPVASSLYGDPSQVDADGRPVQRMSGYAAVLDPDGKLLAIVSVELPAAFAETSKDMWARVWAFGALAGACVLFAAIFLVRQRVHVPIYRLVRAMQGEDGVPQRARVRWRDEIGTLTAHYNEMVDRLAEKDKELRELYARARERAVYLQGYSNCLVDGAPLGVVAVDKTGVLTVWNAAATRILGRPARLGAGVADEVGAEHTLARALLHALQGSVTSQAMLVVGEGTDDEDERRLVELSCAPFRGEDGALLGATALLSDRTEMEQLRRSASRNERLAAIGSLGAGLAHEIKNPLGAISGFAELIERRQSGGDTGRLVKRLRDEVGSLDRFLREFLAFARDDRVRREATDLNDVVRTSVDSALRAHGVDPGAAQQALAGTPVPAPGGTGTLEVVLELAADLPTLALDEALVRSALTNLALNALQVMPRGGKLGLRTQRVGGNVYVRVRDQGPGVPLEQRERIFDPLYTTRAEGTGLGLAIVHKTISAHGGKVTVRDAPGGGAEFVVRLPLLLAGDGQDPMEPAAAPAAGSGAPGSAQEDSWLGS